jgi:hypothetical protein
MMAGETGCAAALILAQFKLRARVDLAAVWRSAVSV